jgi:hypothetical protein
MNYPRECSANGKYYVSHRPKNQENPSKHSVSCRKRGLGTGTGIARGFGAGVTLGRDMGRNERRMPRSPAQAFSAEIG